jgi:hypothetical protein
MPGYYETDPRDPDAPVELTEYEGRHGLVTVGATVEYDNPEMPGLGSPAPEGEPLTVSALYDFGDIPASLDGGRWVTAILNGGAYECLADNLRAVACSG